MRQCISCYFFLSYFSAKILTPLAFYTLLMTFYSALERGNHLQLKKCLKTWLDLDNL